MAKRTKRKSSKSRSIIPARVCLSPIILLALMAISYMLMKQYMESRAKVTEASCTKAAKTVPMQRKQCRYCSCTGEKNRPCCDPEICSNTSNCDDGDSNPLWEPDEVEEPTSPNPGWFDWFNV